MREQNYVTIMSILGQEGKLGLIKEIFDQMRDAMITPTVHSYSVLISGWVLTSHNYSSSPVRFTGKNADVASDFILVIDMCIGARCKVVSWVFCVG